MTYFPAEKSANAVFISVKKDSIVLFNDALNHKGGMD